MIWQAVLLFIKQKRISYISYVLYKISDIIYEISYLIPHIKYLIYHVRNLMC